MTTLNRIVILLCLIVFYSGIVVNNAYAQTSSTCPQGKTAVIWVNGITVKQVDWDPFVRHEEVNFLAVHPSLNNCVKFFPLYNTSFGALLDLYQSDAQLQLAAFQDRIDQLNTSNPSDSELAELITKFAKADNQGFRKDDPDVAAVYNEVLNQWKAGYRQVILVGHSQGSIITNEVYRMLRQDGLSSSGTLPNTNILALVSIATPASTVADGRQMHTKQCNDVIQFVKFFSADKPLAPNLNDNNRLWPCVAPEVIAYTAAFGVPLLKLIDSLTVLHDIKVHNLESSYMADGSATQKQIYQQMEDSLPDPGCEGKVNCYLKDDFSGGDYTDNVEKTVIQGSSIRQDGGLLWMDTNNSYRLGRIGGMVKGHLVSRSRRVFTGDFTLTFRGRISDADDVFVGLYNVADETKAIGSKFSDTTSASFPGESLTGPNYTSEFIAAGWHTWTFTKTSTQVTMSVDGVHWTTSDSKEMSGYYLGFDLQGNNNMQIDDLSVVRSTTATSAPPAPTPVLTLAANCSANPAVITAGASARFTGTSTGGTGTKTYAWGGDVFGNDLTATYVTVSSTKATTGKATFTVTDSGSPKQKASASCELEVKAYVPPPVATYEMSPSSQSISIRSGESRSADVTFTSKNGPAGNAALTLYCVSTCLSNTNYDFVSGQTNLPRNGSTPLRVTFHTGTNTLSGRFDYVYTVVSGNISDEARISVTITGAPPPPPPPPASPAVQKPSLDSVKVNVTVKAGKKFSAILNGSGFVKSSKAYICTSTKDSSCSSLSTDYVSSKQLSTNATASSSGTVYFKVVNPGSISSAYVSLKVNK